MEQNQSLSPEAKERLYAQIAEAMIVALEHGLMTSEESAASADFILKRLDSMQLLSDVSPFLRELSTNWSAYMSVYQDWKKDELLKKVSVELDQLNQKA